MESSEVFCWSTKHTWFLLFFEIQVLQTAYLSLSICTCDSVYSNGKNPTTYHIHQSQKRMGSIGNRELKTLLSQNVFLISTECNLIVKNYALLPHNLFVVTAFWSHFAFSLYWSTKELIGTKPDKKMLGRLSFGHSYEIMQVLRKLNWVSRKPTNYFVFCKTF